MALAQSAVAVQAVARGKVAGAGERMGEAKPGQTVIVALLQETAEPPEETPQPPDQTAEPTPGETVEPPDQTAEPTPSATPAPPVETGEPTPGSTPPSTTTPDQTAAPGDTATPGATQPAAATATVTATPTLTPTPMALTWPTDWPLGTIRIGQEPVPSPPVEVTTGEWLRLALGLVVVALVAIFGGRAAFRLLESFIARQHLDLDEKALALLGSLLPWGLAAIGFHVIVWWVDFQNRPARELFADLAFLAYLGVATLAAWRLVDWFIGLYAMRILARDQAATIEKLRPLLRRWARLLILLFSLLVGLGRFQGGFSVPTILVLLIGFTLSLAARDTLTDVIAGFSILIDQPFRIGDYVEVEGVETWATVANIGLRTTVLLTRHNVEIIVPNSTISENRVINYNYPDPRYRMQTHVGIAFGTKVGDARRVMSEAVRGVDGVLRGEPVDALYVEIGDSAMIFRVRWWINCHRDWEASYDAVHAALHEALAEAGIECPFPTQTLNLQFTPEMADRVSRAIRGDDGNTGETTEQEVRSWPTQAQSG